jgi:acetyl esterase/lipase
MVKELIDIAYSKEHTSARKLDIFIPDEKKHQASLLFIFGGGFSAGSKEKWGAVARRFCEMGYITASAGYRLAPSHRFPAAVEDVRLAMAYLRNNATEYGINPETIAGVGSSAGGYLAAMLGMIDKDDKLGWTEELGDTDTQANAVVCYCPVLTMRQWPEHLKMITNFMGKEEKDDPELFVQASPLYRVTGQEPPFLFIHGQNDDTVPVEHSLQMCDAINQKGGKAEKLILPDAEHGFGYGVTTPNQVKAIMKIDNFLYKYIS